MKSISSDASEMEMRARFLNAALSRMKTGRAFTDSLLLAELQRIY